MDSTVNQQSMPSATISVEEAKNSDSLEQDTASALRSGLQNDDVIIQLANDIRHSIEIKDRKYRMKTYEMCFVGSELISLIVEKSKGILTREDAIKIGQKIMDLGTFIHVVDKEKPLIDGYYFYRIF